ncbi:hypothetical protein D9757_014203 [Collybiopsis confluens]|uniref:MYND-type domain-containing protein n=1 Tax=Collybiopsis confluens TaxID=2823264 RepID=A0A8H5CKI6_9AGAR|nr:hypothetical protein D9757_014203 [Collybiopsis confluens]
MSRPGDSVFECREHHKMECSSCFNWGKIAVEALKREIKAKNSSKPGVLVDVSKEEKLKFLSSMGLELTLSTRLPDETIDKKFRSAIDAVQWFSKAIESLPFDPSSLPLWSKESSPSRLFDSFKKGSVAEILAYAAGKQVCVDSYEGSFMGVRQTAMSMAKTLDNTEIRIFVLQDKACSYAICVRVVEVRRLPNDIPVVILLYGRGARNAPPQETLAWVQENLSTARSTGMPQIVSTPEEQKLLLAILNMNARRLSPDYAPKRKRTESNFTLSFLLPMGPLGQTDIGKLTQHTGCVACGTKSSSKCAQCLSVEYCGPECQKVHWKEHKPMCISLKGGTWVDIRFSTMPVEARLAAALGQKLSFSFVNNMASNLSRDPGQIGHFSNDNPPPLPSNIRGNNLFLIKMQKGNSIMIYDRTRSIQVYLCRDIDPKGYDETMVQMHTGFKGLKVYRWAKRVGEEQLSVCLDRPLLKDPQW